MKKLFFITTTAALMMVGTTVTEAAQTKALQPNPLSQKRLTSQRSVLNKRLNTQRPQGRFNKQSPVSQVTKNIAEQTKKIQDLQKQIAAQNTKKGQSKNGPKIDALKIDLANAQTQMKSYLTETQVKKIIDDRSFQTAADVRALINASIPAYISDLSLPKGANTSLGVPAVSKPVTAEQLRRLTKDYRGLDGATLVGLNGWVNQLITKVNGILGALGANVRGGGVIPGGTAFPGFLGDDLPEQF